MRCILVATAASITVLTAFSTAADAGSLTPDAFQIAQAPPQSTGEEPKRDEHKGDGDHKNKDERKEQRQGPKPGGDQPRPQGAPQERGERRGPDNQPARQAQPQQGQPAERKERREERRERTREEGPPPARRDNPPREVQAPQPPQQRQQAQPQNVSPPQGGPGEHRERGNDRGERHERTRDEAPPRRDNPPRDAQAPQTPPPSAKPVVQEPPREERRDRGGPPSQQAQPKPGNAPPAVGGAGDDRGPNRGPGPDHGPGGPKGNPPPRDAQTLPPPGPGPARPDSKGPPPQANGPQPGPGPRRDAGGPGSIEDIKRGRHQRVEDGGKRTIIEEPGNRTIVQEKGAPAMIRHDEGERMRRTSRDFRSERRPDGGNLTIAIRPGGIEVYSEFDRGGRLMRRYRRDRDGREWDLIDNRRFRGAPIFIDLPPPRLHIPRDRYIMDYERASDDDLYDALMDGPVDRLDRGYSLDEVRYNVYLRDRMRRVDLDTVTFDFGAWQVPYDQYGRLERIARIINRILDRNPDEVFLVEGHTDAVGSEIDNLTLSDRRAEEVAVILTETFGVPPENLVTQGYGEEFLKIPTAGPERANRRVAVRRITPLLARNR